MVALGSVCRPVPDCRYTEMRTSRHLTRGSSTARKPQPSTVNECTSRGCACQGVATTSPPLVRLVGVAPAQNEWSPALWRVVWACDSWSRLRWVSWARRQSALVCWNQCRISCLHLVMLAIARVSDLGCPGA